MNDILDFIKIYRSDIIGIVQIFITLWIEYKDHHRK